MAKDLVIVRAGAGSLHPLWLHAADGTVGEPEWDLVVSHYAPQVPACAHPRVEHHFSPGGKWSGLEATLAWLGDRLAQYEYFWLPDDDVLTGCRQVNTMFRQVRAEGLEACQPALTWDSYANHQRTVQVPGLLLHYSDQVEIMAPCWSRGLLAAMRPYFAASHSGFGFEKVADKLLGHGRAKQAIFHNVTMMHTRPGGGPHHALVAVHGTTPNEEKARLLRREGLDGVKDQFAIFGGKDRQGRPLGPSQVMLRYRLHKWRRRWTGRLRKRAPFGRRKLWKEAHADFAKYRAALVASLPD